MKDSIGEQYKQTIYTVMESEGLTTKVTHATTSKKKMWEFISKKYTNWFKVISEQNEGERGEIGSYSAFTKHLDYFALYLRIPDPSRRRLLVINTWKV